MIDPTIKAFSELFRGRVDCYGSWSGGCVRERVTDAHWEYHLQSDDPADWLGIYPAGLDRATWGCVDIDGGDFPEEGVLDHPDYDRKNPEWHDWQAMHALARKLTLALAVKDIHGHIERTRNGYHVWVFPERVTSARIMRRALMAACAAVGYDPKEVNPKQERLEGDKVGNYVRLPYHGHFSRDEATDGAWRQPERYFVTTDFNVPQTLNQFLMWAQRTPIDKLETVSHLWTPPERDWSIAGGLTADHSSAHVDPSTVHRLDGVAYTIWRDGPLPGSDRSGTLAHLTHRCRECGLTPSEALTVVRSADMRWGQKFASRADGLDRMTELVERAYAT